MALLINEGTLCSKDVHLDKASLDNDNLLSMTFNLKSEELSMPMQENNDDFEPDDQLNELLISLGYERLLITDYDVATEIDQEDDSEAEIIINEEFISLSMQ